MEPAEIVCSGTGFLETFISGKNQERGQATLMVLRSRWVGGDINAEQTTI